MRRDDRDAAEIEMLYRQHGPALLLFATAMTGERSRAQDVVHQVFLNLIARRGLSRIESKKAYLFACVRNAILNEAKVQERSRPLDPNASWFMAPQQDYSGERNLRRALEALPKKQREVIVLHIRGELTFLEIGEVIGGSANTAASRYRYALAKLREAMLANEESRADAR